MLNEEGLRLSTKAEFVTDEAELLDVGIPFCFFEWRLPSRLIRRKGVVAKDRVLAESKRGRVR